MKKIDLGGVKTSTSTTRASHPVITVDDETTLLLEQFALINPQFKTLKNQSETLSKQLGPKIKAAYFARYAGVPPESSTMLVVAGGRSIKLTVKESYSTKCNDEALLIAALGAELVAKHFRQATVLKLELDKCPEDKQEPFATAVIELAAKMGLSDAISATQCIQPKAGFHDARTTILSAEQNIKLDAVLPITAYPQL